MKELITIFLLESVIKEDKGFLMSWENIEMLNMLMIK